MKPPRWWWDVTRGVAVDDETRGSASDLLGPYPTKEAAENWRETRDAREAAWKDDDDED